MGAKKSGSVADPHGVEQNGCPEELEIRAVMLTDGLLRRSEADGAGAAVEATRAKVAHRSQRGAQLVLVISKQRRGPGAHCSANTTETVNCTCELTLTALK